MGNRKNIHINPTLHEGSVPTVFFVIQRFKRGNNKKVVGYPNVDTYNRRLSEAATAGVVGRGVVTRVVGKSGSVSMGPKS